MAESLSQASLSFAQKILEQLLEWPAYVKCNGGGLLYIQFKMHGTHHKIIFDEDLVVVEYILSNRTTGDFYRTPSGCTFSDRAPKDWIHFNGIEAANTCSN